MYLRSLCDRSDMTDTSLIYELSLWHCWCIIEPGISIYVNFCANSEYACDDWHLLDLRTESIWYRCCVIERGLWRRNVCLTMSRNWFRWWLGTAYTTRGYLNQWWHKPTLHKCVTQPHTRPREPLLWTIYSHNKIRELTLNWKQAKHNHIRHNASPIIRENHCRSIELMWPYTAFTHICGTHAGCCYTKRGGITTNLAVRNHWGYVTDVPKYHNAGIWSTD